MELYTRVQLEKMKMKGLVEVYNKLVLAGHAPGKQIKSLKTKPSGIKRILDIQASIPEDSQGNNPGRKHQKAVRIKSVIPVKMQIKLHVKQLINDHKDLSNEEFSKLTTFKALCEDVSIPATTRQASKFRNFRGLAFKMA